jgi:hypothetical protein
VRFCIEVDDVGPRLVALICEQAAGVRRIARLGELPRLGGEVSPNPMAVLNEEKGKHSERVFTYKGDSLVQTKHEIVAQCIATAATKNVRWHDMRHVWATWDVMSNTPMAGL